MTIANWRRTLRKLQAMDRHEIADRFRQEYGKRSDGLLSRLPYDFTRNALVREAVRPGSFFFAPEQVGPLLERLRQRLPRQVEQIISRSERVLAHRFDLLGFEELSFGEPINWHLDAVHAKEAPPKSFHRVKYLDFDEVGDSKITWELNRHQHLVTLAKAYRLTGDERYASEIRSQWRNWHAANPYPLGINWASTLEVGFRSLSWMWMYYLLEGTGSMGPRFREEWLRAQALNGRHLERYLSTYFSPNTHLLGEGVALFFLGTMCGELSGAERWKVRGWQIVLEEAHRQVAADGMHFEKSTYYHVYALDFFLHAVILASANGLGVPKEMEETLEKMLDALSLLGCGGPPPRLGDDDGGRLFDGARNRAEHMLDPLAAGAVLFQRGDFKSLAEELREETIWLLGVEGIEQWDRLEAQAAAPASAALESASIYSLSTSAGRLTIDCGPSPGQSHGHDHADALNVCLQAEGRSLLIDPGTYEYVGPGPERNRFRGTAMHNTLRVDEKDQAEPDGPFSWKQQFRACAEQWISGESFDLFIGSHDGYMRLASPVLHRRWVVALRSGIFLVRDVAEGGGDEHQLDISWHLAPELRPRGEHQFRLQSAPQGLAILSAQGHCWKEETRPGQWSAVYGQESLAAILNFGVSATLPAEFATLLIPLQEMRDAPGTFTRLQHPNASPIVQAYRYESGDAGYLFFFAPSNRTPDQAPSETETDQSWQSGSVSSDAEFVCVTKRSENDEPEIVFSNGSRVDIEGVPVLRTRHRVARCERLAGTPPRLFCSDEGAVFLDVPARALPST
jgi:hypothetical protein